MADELICTVCNGFTARPGWYPYHARYRPSVDHMIRIHRRDCLKIPRVTRYGTAGWWRVEFHTGYLFVGSFDQALHVALTRRVGYV